MTPTMVMSAPPANGLLTGCPPFDRMPHLLPPLPCCLPSGSPLLVLLVGPISPGPFSARAVEVDLERPPPWRGRRGHWDAAGQGRSWAGDCVLFPLFFDGVRVPCQTLAQRDRKVAHRGDSGAPWAGKSHLTPAPPTSEVGSSLATELSCLCVPRAPRGGRPPPPLIHWEKQDACWWYPRRNLRTQGARSPAPEPLCMVSSRVWPDDKGQQGGGGRPSRTIPELSPRLGALHPALPPPVVDRQGVGHGAMRAHPPQSKRKGQLDIERGQRTGKKGRTEENTLHERAEQTG